MRKWLANVFIPKVIPEPVRRKAHDNVLRSLQQEREMFELHGETLEAMLAIISSAESVHEFPKQVRLILDAIGKTPDTPGFSRDDVNSLARVAAALARQYEKEVRALMEEKEKAIKQ